MEKQPTALRLAELIRSRYGNDINDEAAEHLKMLYTINQTLLEALQKAPCTAKYATDCVTCEALELGRNYIEEHG